MSFAHAVSHVTNCSHLLLFTECLLDDSGGKCLKQVDVEQVGGYMEWRTLVEEGWVEEGEK